jgi:hypothetical protein
MPSQSTVTEAFGCLPFSLRNPGAKDSPSHAAPAAFSVGVHELGDPCRPLLESLVQELYRKSYSAVIRAWMPVLASLSQRGCVTAVVGYRSALEALYLEQYLRAPIEDVLERVLGVKPGREQVAEVGHFSAFAPGAGRVLIPKLGVHLRAKGFRWAVSTVTAPLHALLLRSGYAPLVLGSADPSFLPEGDYMDWGTYYQHNPVVVAVDLHSRKALERSHEH